jgi:hypothetical protein
VIDVRVAFKYRDLLVNSRYFRRGLPSFLNDNSGLGRELINGISKTA